jgi:glycerol-3-phosphate responsive antiterminator
MVDDYMADLPVQNEIIVELKAVKSLDHIYDSAIKVCFLLNFATSKVQIRRLIYQVFKAFLSVFICDSYRIR